MVGLVRITLFELQSEKGILVGAPFGRASIDTALMEAKMKNKYRWHREYSTCPIGC